MSDSGTRNLPLQGGILRPSGEKLFPGTLPQRSRNYPPPPAEADPRLGGAESYLSDGDSLTDKTLASMVSIFIPHSGHLAGRADTFSGCIGHAWRTPP